MLLKSAHFAYLPVAYGPMILGVADGIILCLHCREVADELLVLKLVERESVAFLVVVVIVLYVGNHSTVYLQHNIVG